MDRMAIIILVIAVLYLMRDLLPVPLFRLPGDVEITTERLHIVLPITTCLLISLVGSIVLSLFSR